MANGKQAWTRPLAKEPMDGAVALNVAVSQDGKRVAASVDSNTVGKDAEGKERQKISRRIQLFSADGVPGVTLDEWPPSDVGLTVSWGTVSKWLGECPLDFPGA